MESKRNETFGSTLFGTNVIQGLGVDVKQQMRRPRGCPARPLSPGPLERPPTYFFLLYIPTYPENIQGANEKQFPPQ